MSDDATVVREDLLQLFDQAIGAAMSCGGAWQKNPLNVEAATEAARHSAETQMAFKDALDAALAAPPSNRLDLLESLCACGAEKAREEAAEWRQHQRPDRYLYYDAVAEFGEKMSAEVFAAALAAPAADAGTGEAE